MRNLTFDYKNHSTDMSVMACEEFYFRNNSTQLNMVIVKKEASKLLIDVMWTAGGTGIMNFNLWSEKGYIKRVRKVLNEFTEEFNLELDEF